MLRNHRPLIKPKHVQLTTLYRRSLTKVRDKLVSGHSPKTFTAKVVRMHYPENVQYLGYKIRSNYNTCISECGNKTRYIVIDDVHVGVKLLNEHDRTPLGFPTEGLPSSSPTEWPSDLDERHSFGSSQRSLSWPSHHGTKCEREQEDQKRMTQNHEEDSKPEWICALWVSWHVYLRERERERERERKREREQNTSQTRKGMKKYNVCMNA